MLQPLVIGLGRSGAGLHLKALRNLARSRQIPLGPVVGCDPRPDLARDLSGVDLTTSPEQALRRVRDPRATVAHVCTPPHDRLPLLRQLADHGVRHLLIEKPIATTRDELASLLRLRERAGLGLMAVTHWLAAELTRRLRKLVTEQPYGPLRRLAIDQDKPRFTRSLASGSHRTALEVEIPHALALAVHLCGPAQVVRASCTELRTDQEARPHLGGARVELHHGSGVRTTLRSDLTSPVRRRSAELEFRDATLVAHYPVGEDDNHAQLQLPGRAPQIFRDDALLAFFHSAYQGFAADGSPGSAQGYFATTTEAARLVCEAKALL
ncbi:Gfo/Idh/MocA family oxidoreductase [Streptomyces sp. NPDC052042]|uniref:Gfo/Idh/MocA family protein n=1 Tax=Streptomyces sp. NPDC052042 TaxID=3365683 RepID=UPI0037D57811